jgi:hypothetical protein
MTRRLTPLLFCASVALAQSGIETPRAGCLRGPDGALRPIYGVAGTFLAGGPAAAGVVSAACSDSLALLKTEDAIEVRDAGLHLLAVWDAPPGPALFAMPPGGQTAFAYFVATGELVRVDAQSPPRAVPESQALGRPFAMASPDAQHLLAVVVDALGARLVRISTADGVVESQVPLASAAPRSKGERPALLSVRRGIVRAPLALLNDGTIVSADGADLVIRRPDGSEERKVLPAAVTAIDQMGGAWLALRLADESAPLALRLDAGLERLCRVPVSESAP